jgi:hypothetical protein
MGLEALREDQRYDPSLGFVCFSPDLSFTGMASCSCRGPLQRLIYQVTLTTHLRT